MASNKIRKDVPDVRDASIVAEGGLTRNAALAVGDPQKITFHRVTALLIHTQRDDLLDKDRIYNNRRTDKNSAVHARQGANLSVGKELLDIRDALKKPLGREHNSMWTSAGWTHNTLEIPDDAADKSALLGTLIVYLGEHPTYENAGQGATAAHCTTLKTQIDTAIAVEQATQTPLTQAKTARKAALNLLHKSLMTLLGELGEELDDLDARYYDYGFTPPGLQGRPGLCRGFVWHPGHEAGTIELDWLNADLAERYQVQKQIVGSDLDFVLAETVQDSDATLEGLPSGSTVKLRVRAVNSHGEGPWSEVLVVVV